MIFFFKRKKHGELLGQKKKEGHLPPHGDDRVFGSVPEIDALDIAVHGEGDL